MILLISHYGALTARIRYEYSLHLQNVRITCTPSNLGGINGYPVSNQTTLNEFSHYSPAAFANDLFDLPLDAHLDPKLLNEEGCSDLGNNQSTQYQTFSSKSEAENLGISQTCYNINTAFVLQPGDNSHASSSQKDTRPIHMTTDSVQDNSDEALSSQKLPASILPDKSNGLRRSGPTSAPRGFVFVSGLADPNKTSALPNKDSRNDAKILKASGGACWRCKFVRKKVIMLHYSPEIMS